MLLFPLLMTVTSAFAQDASFPGLRCNPLSFPEGMPALAPYSRRAGVATKARIPLLPATVPATPIPMMMVCPGGTEGQATLRLVGANVAALESFSESRGDICSPEFTAAQSGEPSNSEEIRFRVFSTPAECSGNSMEQSDSVDRFSVEFTGGDTSPRYVQIASFSGRAGSRSAPFYCLSCVAVPAEPAEPPEAVAARSSKQSSQRLNVKTLPTVFSDSHGASATSSAGQAR